MKKQIVVYFYGLIKYMVYFFSENSNESKNICKIQKLLFQTNQYFVRVRN